MPNPSPAGLRFDYESGFELRRDRVQFAVYLPHLGAFLFSRQWNIGDVDIHSSRLVHKTSRRLLCGATRTGGILQFMYGYTLA
jgi:hypothetical protein